jgi:hypothetical protein
MERGTCRFRTPAESSFHLAPSRKNAAISPSAFSSLRSASLGRCGLSRVALTMHKSPAARRRWRGTGARSGPGPPCSGVSVHHLLTTCTMLGGLRQVLHLDAVNIQEDRKTAEGGGDGNEYLLEAEDCIGYSSRALFSFRAIFIRRSMGSVSYPLRVRSVPNSPTCSPTC